MNKISNIITIALSALFILGFSLWGIFSPDKELSTSERRKLEQLPELSFDTIMDGSFMSDFEKYTLDQFPLRDDFRTLKALTSFYVMGRADNNDIYITDGFAVKQEYPLNVNSINWAASRFKNVYEKYLKENGSKVYLSVVPDKNYYAAHKSVHLSLDYDKMIALLREGTPFAEYIDIFPLLDLTDYYKTDTHWRQEKIEDIAKHIASAMGVELKAEYEVKEADRPFYGVYYGQAALPLPAEKLYYLENDILSSCRVYDYESSSYIDVYDMDKLQGNDLYEVFLSGSKSLLSIENPSATTDKELIIFRDSFGSSIAPLLVEGYSKITIVDIRYISPEILGRFIEFNGQDVLFLYSTLVLNNSSTIK